MKKASSESKNPSDASIGDDVSKLKEIIAKKSKDIKELVSGKITLANKLKVAQEKNGGETLAKLTNELKESMGRIQIEMNTRNNRIAMLEAENVKLNDFNNKMYEICKKSGVFEKLETLDVKDTEPHTKVVVPSNKESEVSQSQFS